VINPKSRLNYSLAAALLLLIVLMVQSLNLRAIALKALKPECGSPGRARRVQRLREQVTETSEAASFLTRKRSASRCPLNYLPK
jgi:hypothetical protein